MSHFYLDASAIVKRYSPETGSAWVQEQITPLAGHTVVLSEITLAEVAAALAAKHRASDGILLKTVLGSDTLNMSTVLTEAFLPRITRILTNFRAAFVSIREIRGREQSSISC